MHGALPTSIVYLPPLNFEIAWGLAVKYHNRDFGSTNYTPVHNSKMLYNWKGQDIVLGKCQGCSTGQDWHNGNNYNTLIKQKKYYCEDSASIFQP